MKAFLLCEVMHYDIPAMIINTPSSFTGRQLRLDLRGLKCPLPVLKVKKALATLDAGDLLLAECTDPLSAIDLPNLARETGNAYEGCTRNEGFILHRIRRTAP